MEGRASRSRPRAGAPRPRGALCCVTALWLACGREPPPPLAYEGTAGQPLALELVNGVPAVAASVDGAQAQLFLIDSGSPVTLLADAAFPSFPAGGATARLAAFELVFPALPTAASALFAGAGACQGPVPAGIIGADVLRGFRFELDYAERRVALADSAGPLVLGSGVETEPAEELAFRLLGGGRVRVGDAVSLAAAATRVVVPLRVEDIVVDALLDTGATTTIISDELLRRLPAAGRPLICCETVATPGRGALGARVTRLRELALGRQRFDNWPVLVLPPSALFAALARETGRPIGAVIGGDLLRQLVSQLDYPRRRWRLARRPGAPPPDPDAYLLPGFTFCAARDAAGAIVQDVFLGSDAFAKGLRTGDRLLAIGGVDVTALERAAVLELLRQSPVGQPVSLRLLTAGGVVERAVRLEQLLPSLS